MSRLENKIKLKSWKKENHFHTVLEREIKFPDLTEILERKKQTSHAVLGKKDSPWKWFGQLDMMIAGERHE